MPENLTNVGNWNDGMQNMCDNKATILKYINKPDHPWLGVSLLFTNDGWSSE